MKRLLLLAALLMPFQAHAARDPQPRVDVAFVLDTTGSMSGLIEGAKAKIWMIAGEIVKGQPKPAVRMGLVGYRDRGDAYVTTRHDLSENLDAVYDKLLAFRAEGGGDTPEHVLKALEDAVTRLSWDDRRQTHKVIYLVGDAPAHLEYGDTRSLEDIVELARRKGILINTIQCGADPWTGGQWRKIAELGAGRYAQIEANGGMQVVSTPYDTRIADLTSKLEGTMQGYGAYRDEADKVSSLRNTIRAKASAPASAERAAYMSGAGSFGRYDLLEAVEKNLADVTSMKESDLPKAFQGLSADERQKKVAALQAERQTMRKEIAGLSKQRADYLSKADKARGAAKGGFDREVVNSIHEQAAAKGIHYESK